MTIFIALDILFFLAVFTALMAVITATFKQMIVAYYAAKSSYYTIVFKLFLENEEASQRLGMPSAALVTSIFKSFFPDKEPVRKDES